MPLKYRYLFIKESDFPFPQKFQRPIISAFIEKHCPHCLKTKIFKSDERWHSRYEPEENCCEAKICYFCLRNEGEC